MLSTQEIYIKGLRDLRTGVLLFIIGLMVSTATALYVYLFDIESYLLPTVIETPMDTQETLRYLEELLAVFLTAQVVTIFTLIFQLIVILAKIVPGVSKLAKADPDYRTSSTLIKVGYVIGTIILIMGLVSQALSFILGVSTLDITLLILGMLGGLLLMMIAVAILIVGDIGFVLLGFKLGEKEAQLEYKIVAVLFIIRLVISIIGSASSPLNLVSGVINLVAFILLYFALSKTIEEKRTMPFTPLIYYKAGPPPI